ncbi:MAG: hypothetical protein HY518_04690 [Candidatus Aenigmarchaeota archaeon]|nr:hypothetical protein [Candidatus Aenigmarchaeota archaeon]
MTGVTYLSDENFNSLKQEGKLEGPIASGHIRINEGFFDMHDIPFLSKRFSREKRLERAVKNEANKAGCNAVYLYEDIVPTLGSCVYAGYLYFGTYAIFYRIRD